VTWLRWKPRLGHAARVAAVTTAVVAVVYVAVALALDVLVGHRLTRDVDQRLSERLSDARHQVLPLRADADRTDRDVNEAPVFLWTATAGGPAVAVTPNAPALPQHAWSTSHPTTATLGSGTFRLAATPLKGQWAVVGQSLAQATHVRGVLIASEILVGPVLLLALYFGSLAIGLKASAPVEQARRRQLEFTADASHELRTPLSVIEAEVGLALSHQRDAGYYRASLERVAGEGKRLHRIVEDLLWLARFDSEPPPPGDEPVDLVTIARNCAERFEPIAAARNLQLSVASRATTPTWIKAPPEWIDRLLGALIDNACRYSHAGGEVRVVVGRSGARVLFAVEDSGSGIAPEDRSGLFDRFQRATDEPGGAGLGLAIADSVVRSTGGRWDIGESPSGGARMEVSWHAAAARDGRPGDRSDSQLGPDGGATPSRPSDDKPELEPEPVPPDGTHR
jgi:signal transduction histidine kinase